MEGPIKEIEIQFFSAQYIMRWKKLNFYFLKFTRVVPKLVY